ncbi:hypothetical protein IRB23SM22_01400 [Alkalibacterium sp. s-m-22]
MENIFWEMGAFYIVFFIVIAGFIFMFGYLLINAYLNSVAEPVTVKAELVEKDTVTNAHSTGDSMSSSTTYSLYFQTEEGERIVLDVSRKNYRLYVVGDHGKLTYQRKRFNSFELE